MNICFLHGRELKLCLTYGTFVPFHCMVHFLVRIKLVHSTCISLAHAGLPKKKIIMSLDGALQEYHEQLLPRDS